MNMHGLHTSGLIMPDGQPLTTPKEETTEEKVERFKDALWKEYLAQEKPTFGTIFEKAKSKIAFLEGVNAGMDLERFLSSSESSSSAG